MVDCHHLGRSFAPHPIKGHKTLQISVAVCCVRVELLIFVVVLRRYWCCADILFEIQTAFKRLQVLQLSSIWCQFTLRVTVYLHKMCLCVHCVGMSLHVYIYIFCDCLCVQCFCWCLHIAAPKRGRLFHLIEGQYLHEHSYKQLSSARSRQNTGCHCTSIKSECLSYSSLALPDLSLCSTVHLYCAKAVERSFIECYYSATEGGKKPSWLFDFVKPKRITKCIPKLCKAHRLSG